jgi:hypothetical protein
MRLDFRFFYESPAPCKTILLGRTTRLKAVSLGLVVTAVLSSEERNVIWCYGFCSDILWLLIANAQGDSAPSKTFSDRVLRCRGQVVSTAIAMSYRRCNGI